MTTKSTAKDIISEATEAFAKEPLIDKAKHNRNLVDAQDALAKEFQALVADTEKLLKQTAEAAGDDAGELREKLKRSLERGKELLQDRQAALAEQGLAAAKATEDYVANNPWKAIGIATGAGFLLGLLSGRR